MATFIFLCDLNTEQECLDRRLFGTNPGESYQHHYRKIVVGDQLFLFNYEIGSLRGPFAAMTVCTFNIEPKAWIKAKRSFPWQVKIDAQIAYETPINADELVRVLPMVSTRIGLMPPAELNEDQTAHILELFRKRNDTAP